MPLDDVTITGDYREHANWDVGLFDLLLSDIPYAIGKDAYNSSPMRVKGVKRVERDQVFFGTDDGFDLDDYAKVCDLTRGSGTTCAAAKHLGRRYVGFEIDPAFADTARRRCEHQAVSGDLFDDIEGAA